MAEEAPLVIELEYAPQGFLKEGRIKKQIDRLNAFLDMIKDAVVKIADKFGAEGSPLITQLNARFKHWDKDKEKFSCDVYFLDASYGKPELKVAVKFSGEVIKEEAKLKIKLENTREFEETGKRWSDELSFDNIINYLKEDLHFSGPVIKAVKKPSRQESSSGEFPGGVV